MSLPKRVTLPSGLLVTLKARGPVRAREGAPLFEEALVAMRDVLSVPPESLALRDFHVLRALLLRSGIIEENEASFPCHNCAEEVRAFPCRALEIGPWVDGELDDEELDTTLAFGEPIDVPDLPLGRVRAAKSVTFEDRTVAAAMHVFQAIAKGPLAMDAALVKALGIVAIGSERAPERIADALAAADDDAFAAVADAFVESHYAPRLSAIAICAACGARNDVEAPLEREFSAAPRLPPKAGAVEGFPDLEAFAERALAIAEPMQESEALRDVELLVDDGVAAVDDGGEPLLGSYVPPGDLGRATVTVYYRTFRAIHIEEGPYDWEAELTETIEHELEHHVYFLRGDDPMDDEEREQIRAEAVRVVGRREAGRRELVGFGASLADFGKRTWPLWVIALVAVLVALWTQR